MEEQKHTGAADVFTAPHGITHARPDLSAARAAGQTAEQVSGVGAAEAAGKGAEQAASVEAPESVGDKLLRLFGVKKG